MGAGIGSPPNDVWPVDGVNTQIFTKYLTGITSAAGINSILHNVPNALTKILSVTTHIYNSNGNRFNISEVNRAESVDNAWHSHWDATYIYMDNCGVALQEQPYRIKIEYTK